MTFHRVIAHADETVRELEESLEELRIIRQGDKCLCGWEEGMHDLRGARAYEDADCPAFRLAVKR